jgi:type VI secretion system secreted protein VgrG
MDRQFSQVNRRLQFQCAAAGDDVLQLIAFTCVEEMSRPFAFTLELIANSQSVNPASLVGQRASFCIIMPDEADTHRWFDGFITSFSYHGSDDRADSSRYHAEISPWIWFMGRTTDCRIFQNVSILDVVREVMNECPNACFDDSRVNAEAYPKLEYIVQYRESDLDFVSRLLERAGIYYYFMSEEGQHKLILADSASGYVNCAQSEATFHSMTSTTSDEDLLIDWEHRIAFRTGTAASTDYNYTTPSTNLRTSASTTMPVAGTADYEHFEYPGDYLDTSYGDKVVNLRLEETEATYDTATGKSRYCTFHAGGQFTVEKHYNAQEQGKSWTLLSVRHEVTLGGTYMASTGAFGHGPSGESEGTMYINEFTCIPSQTAFRPPRLTERPNVGGLQTAIVVGESGQEIQVDNLGRIRLQFFWDRRGNKKADASRWVRVAQTWAGAGFGAWFLPRVGHEVVVAFEEGDPDRPLVVGCVYHAENKVPYDQPANKTQSGIKTRSSYGGGANNFNELRFEDLKGSELLYVQAEKDRQVLVKNNNTENVNVDEALTVGNNRTKNVVKNETTTIGVDRTEKVGNNEQITIGTNRTENVGSNEQITIGANRTENVGSNEQITIGSNRTENVGSNEQITIGADRTESVGNNEQITIGAKRTTSVGSDDSLTVGGNASVSVSGDISVSGDGKGSGTAMQITITAQTQLTLQCGASQIVLTPAMITIQGPLVKINC